MELNDYISDLNYTLMQQLVFYDTSFWSNTGLITITGKMIKSGGIPVFHVCYIYRLSFSDHPQYNDPTLYSTIQGI